MGNQLAPNRDQPTKQKPANDGPFATLQEISADAGLRGGPGKTRTSNQAVMGALPSLERSE
jgi:hypothetical protein